MISDGNYLWMRLRPGLQQDGFFRLLASLRLWPGLLSCRLENTHSHTRACTRTLTYTYTHIYIVVREQEFSFTLLSTSNHIKLLGDFNNNPFRTVYFFVQLITNCLWIMFFSCLCIDLIALEFHLSNLIFYSFYLFNKSFDRDGSSLRMLWASIC